MDSQQQEELWNELANEREKPAAELDASPPAETLEGANPEPDQESTPAEESPAAAATPIDPLDEIRDQLAKIVERQRNAEGHIGGLTAAQKRFADEVRAAAAARTDVANAPSAAAVKEAAEDPAEWASLKQDFPDWAKATESLLNSRLANVAQAKGYSEEQVTQLIEQRVSSVSEKLRTEAIDLALDAQFPGWKDEVRKPDFAAWLQVQSADIQALEKSPAVGDAVRLLRAYEQAKSAPNPVIAQRAKKLEAAAALPKGVTAPPAKTPDEMTLEELWAHEAKKREQAKTYY
jgi:histidinol phosphatase-like enzyme